MGVCFTWLLAFGPAYLVFNSKISGNFTRCARAAKKLFFVFAPSRVKGEALSGGWSPHMDYPGGPLTTHDCVYYAVNYGGNFCFVTN